MSLEMRELDLMMIDMDIPDRRRDLASRANIRWLLRNLPVRNGSHPNIAEVMRGLRAMAR